MIYGIKRYKKQSMLGKLLEVTCVVSYRLLFLSPWLFRTMVLRFKFFVVKMKSLGERWKEVRLVVGRITVLLLGYMAKGLQVELRSLIS